MTIPAGYSDFHFEWQFVGREPEKYLKVALHFESHNEEENEKLMDYIATRKDEIEKKIGEKLFFGKMGSKWREIYVRQKVRTLDDSLVNEELKHWAVDMMIKFYDTLKPLLDEAVRKIRG